MSPRDMLRPALEKLLDLPPDRVGLVYDFLRKMTSPDGLQEAKMFLRGEVAVGGLFQQPLVRNCDNFGGYRRALSGARMELTYGASHMMDHEKFLRDFARDRVYLGIATTVELTGSDKSETQQVFEAIAKRGAALCPAWVGPELALYKPLPEGLTLAMDPIPGHGNEPSVFWFAKEGTLAGKGAAPGYCWWGDTNWVYAVAG